MEANKRQRLPSMRLQPFSRVSSTSAHRAQVKTSPLPYWAGALCTCGPPLVRPATRKFDVCVCVSMCVPHFFTCAHESLRAVRATPLTRKPNQLCSIHPDFCSLSISHSRCRHSFQLFELYIRTNLRSGASRQKNWASCAAQKIRQILCQKNASIHTENTLQHTRAPLISLSYDTGFLCKALSHCALISHNFDEMIF